MLSEPSNRQKAGSSGLPSPELYESPKPTISFSSITNDSEPFPSCGLLTDTVPPPIGTVICAYSAHFAFRGTALPRVFAVHIQSASTGASLIRILISRGPPLAYALAYPGPSRLALTTAGMIPCDPLAVSFANVATTVLPASGASFFVPSASSSGKGLSTDHSNGPIAWAGAAIAATSARTATVRCRIRPPQDG